MNDNLGRRFHYLRLSVTDVCNFRCVYCLPNGGQKSDHTPLSLAEIAALVRAFAHAGMRKVRLTGGEPTVRRDIVDIVSQVRADVQTLALSTNGYRLEELAEPLARAGLDQVNVSIDSLDRARFAEITGHDRLPEILRGVQRCLDLGIAVKINAVLMRDLNDDALDAFLAWITHTPITVRFIQLMRTGDNGLVFLRHHRPCADLEQTLRARGFTPIARRHDAGPAVELAHPDFAGRIGFIAPYDEGFCDSCNRLRITSAGRLQLCLFGDGTTDLRPWIMGDPEALMARVRDALVTKPPEHRLRQHNPGTTRHLAMVGG